MKQFNLDEYIKDPSKKVVTRDGRNVKIHCTNFTRAHNIIAQIEGNDFSASYHKDGIFTHEEESNYDLFFASEKHEGWVNIYKAGIAEVMGWTLDKVAEENISKLASRQKRGVIDGEGDNR